MLGQFVFKRLGLRTILLTLCALLLIPVWWGGLCAQGLDDALIKAVKYGDTARVKTLLSKGADVNAKDEWTNTVLAWAVMHDHLDCATVLLEKGADVNIKSFRGLSTLHLATSNGNPGMVKLLLANGADVNAEDAYQWTALMNAINLGSIELVEILLKSGADVNARNYRGRTSLFIAENLGHTEIAQKLKASGAVAAGESIAGTIQKTDRGIVLSADNGDTYIIIGKDLSEMIGQTVNVTGTLAEGVSGKTLTVISVKPAQY
jgi:ankyrin repeat protein